VIVLIGENRTFDNIYGTYQPTNGTVANLLSKGIVNVDGSPGPHYSASTQFSINSPYPAQYFIDSSVTKGKEPYLLQPPKKNPFPPPNTAYVPTAPGGLMLVDGFAQGSV
jgi:phospholipase C